MTEWPQKLKEEMTETRNKLREARENLKTGVIEKKAKQAGMSVEQYSKDTFTKLETRIGKISGNLAAGAYKFGGKAKEASAGVSADVKKLHQTIKDKKAEVKGGKVEERTLAALEAVEKSIDAMILKMKS